METIREQMTDIIRRFEENFGVVFEKNIDMSDEPESEEIVEWRMYDGT